jgi:hypothetical protein
MQRVADFENIVKLILTNEFVRMTIRNLHTYTHQILKQDNFTNQSRDKIIQLLFSFAIQQNRY